VATLADNAYDNAENIVEAGGSTVTVNQDF